MRILHSALEILKPIPFDINVRYWSLLAAFYDKVLENNQTFLDIKIQFYRLVV